MVINAVSLCKTTCRNEGEALFVYCEQESSLELSCHMLLESREGLRTMLALTNV